MAESDHHRICVTCGVQHDAPVDTCKICEDDRQYVGWGGQQWTTVSGLEEAGYGARIQEMEPGLVGIGTEPSFAIGQRALLVMTPGLNVLWDCVSHLDEATVDAVSRLGGIDVISMSHPHFYGSVVEWADAFDAEIVLPEADRDWICRNSPRYSSYEDRAELGPGLQLLRCGGHFDGSAVLHWQSGAAGRGALMTGDTITVVMDRRYVSFMRSYPNLIPLEADAIRTIVDTVQTVDFDRIYGGWWGRVVASGARAAVTASAGRYQRWSGG